MASAVRFAEEHYKTNLRPPSKGHTWNYVTDYTVKWRGSYLYFVAKYACPDPNATTRKFYAEFVCGDAWLSHRIQNNLAFEVGARLAAGVHSVGSDNIDWTYFRGGTAAVYFGGPNLAIGARIRFGRLQGTGHAAAGEFVLLWSVVHLRLATTW